MVAGERNPAALAQLRHARVQVSEEVVVKSQVGDYRREHLFRLGQSLEAYRYYQTLIPTCDQEIEDQLQTLTASFLRMPHSCRQSVTLTAPVRTSFALICAVNCIASGVWT